MPHTLVTITFSHFCEKARWALDAAGVAFREDGHCPGFHRRHARRAGGRSSVPVLVAGDGTVLNDSPLIVRFADARAPADRKLLPPEGRARDEALELERRLDVDFGPHVRRFAYFHVLPRRDVALRLFDLQAPRGERRAVRVVFPVLRRFMRKFMQIDETRALESRDGMRRVFDDMGQRLADGRPYLLGDRFGAADIAFAAFAAPLLVPSEHPVMRLDIEALPEALAAEVRTLRETPAGAFALRMYREHRRTA